MSHALPSPAAGRWLIFASIAFWLSWVLMPGVGITDARQILDRVGTHRGQVYLSVVLQLFSAAAYAPGLAGVLLSDVARHSRGVRIGAIVLLIGAMGSAADAIFHLVAYEMTAPGLTGEQLEVIMRQLQGPDLALLLPFVAAFFIGHATLVAGLRLQRVVSSASTALLTAAPLFAVAGAAAASAGLVPARLVGLTVLAAVAGSLVLVGVALQRR
ncbi:MAG: hypothetical protein SF182_27150 [Deltaproteobacteria bacterium]|nr:hypothetical protein [Deltaproteobacteria bacterium]